MLNKKKTLMIKAEENLLLHAILEKNDSAALDYYKQWNETVEFDNVEAGSLRLLPLLYKRLAPTGQPVPHLEKLKGIYRKSLYRNSLLFHKTFSVMAELEKMGIPVILLKGTALIAAYYEDIGSRPMNDVDFLVREEDVEKALRFLEESGWQNKFSPSLSKPVKNTHGIGLLNPEGYCMDIHWRVFYHCSWDRADLTIWEQTEKVAFKGLTIRILNPAMQILHNCYHGIKWDSFSSIRWIVDTLMVMRKRSGSIDWKLLVSEAAKRKLTVTMLHALGFLNAEFGAGIPEEVLNHLAEQPKDPLEYRLFRILIAPPSFSDMKRKWLVHSFSMESSPFWKKAALFPSFLKEAWGLHSVHQLPLDVIKRTIKKLARHYHN